MHLRQGSTTDQNKNETTAKTAEDRGIQQPQIREVSHLNHNGSTANEPMDEGDVADGVLTDLFTCTAEAGTQLPQRTLIVFDWGMRISRQKTLRRLV